MYHIFFISPSVDGQLGCLSLVAVVLVPKVFFPGSFHRQRNLVDYSPWDHEELDMTEHMCQKPINEHLLSILYAKHC